MTTAGVGAEPEWNELQALSIGTLNAATRWFYGALIAGALSAAASLAVVATNLERHPTVQLVADGLIVLVALAGFVLFRRFQSLYDLGLELRRVALIEEALGQQASPRARTDLKLRLPSRLRNRATQHADAAASYYRQSHKPGANRLLDAVQESAFFTAAEYKKLSWVYLLILCGMSVVALLVLISAVASSGDQEIRIRTARVVLAMVPVAMSVGLVSWVLDLNRLADGINRVEGGLDHMRKAAVLPVEDVMRAHLEYQLLISKGLPVPGWLYRGMQDELNKLWEERTR